MQTRFILGTTLLALLLTPALRADIGYQFATVGNPGNAADSTGYGSVGYTYSIGTYDVTLTQYTAFLNAVAATVPTRSTIRKWGRIGESRASRRMEPAGTTVTLSSGAVSGP